MRQTRPGAKDQGGDADPDGAGAEDGIPRDLRGTGHQEVLEVELDNADVVRKNTGDAGDGLLRDRNGEGLIGVADLRYQRETEGCFISIDLGVPIEVAGEGLPYR